MKLKYFKTENTPEENKKLYRQLSKRFHPDMQGGSEKLMQEINLEYNHVKTKNKNPKKEDNPQAKKAQGNVNYKKNVVRRADKKRQKIIKSMAREVLNHVNNYLSALIDSL